MSKASVEDIKLASAGLRGQLAELFADTSTPNIPDDNNFLLKHHGSYQQDDRDRRAALVKAKQEKAWSFMIRSKMPGGRISAKQWMIHDELCTKAFGNMRLTNRQGHPAPWRAQRRAQGSHSQHLPQRVSAPWVPAATVVRNTMGPAAPVKDAVHADTQRLTEEISQRFLWRSNAYADIWLDGEKIEPEWIKDPEVNPAVARGDPRLPKAMTPSTARSILPAQIQNRRGHPALQ